VPFWLSQPIVNTPSTAIRTDAKKRFIFIPFPKEVDLASSPAGTIPAVRGFPFGCKRATSPRTKKADVAEHSQAFDHVGLLVNKPPGQGRVALHLVVRRLGIDFSRSHADIAGAPPEYYSTMRTSKGKWTVFFRPFAILGAVRLHEQAVRPTRTGEEHLAEELRDGLRG
jgi:hypothetical protein